MSRRKKTGRTKARQPGRWASLDPERRRRVLKALGVCFATGLLVVAVTMGVRRLEAHVQDRILRAFPDANVEFVDIPPVLESLARNDLDAAVAGLFEAAWTEPDLCRRIARRLATVGWIERVRYVRRLSDATFKISADYRIPVAMVQQDDGFLLVDRQAVRLPGVYRYDPAWLLIQGVQAPAPEPGVTWAGEDIRAALAIVSLIAGEPFAHQITAVLVNNYGGRENRLAAHIELATDRAGGRIRWGSAPGREIEENTAEAKIALLRANYTATGRCDADYPVIDISTYPDRFTVPP